MRHSVQYLVLGLLAVSVAAVDPLQKACTIDTVSEFNPCRCPDGTNYQYYITRAILGVNAKDFFDYTGSCTYFLSKQTSFPCANLTFTVFNLTWLTIDRQENNGTDNVPGATRTFYTGENPGGNVSFTDEVCISYTYRRHEAPYADN